MIARVRDFDVSAPWLCADPVRRRLFAAEPEGFLACGGAVAVDVFGQRLQDVLWRVALLVIQPDAIARRQIDQCLGFLARHDLTAVHAHPFVLSHAMAEELWRFQFNAISPGSKEIALEIYCNYPSLLVYLWDEAPDPARSACDRFTGIKGSSDPSRRAAGSLRADLNSVNRIFGAVHGADEPIDVLRESAIFVGHDGLADIYGALLAAADRPPGGRLAGELVAAGTNSVYGPTPAHDLDPGKALERVRSMIAAGSEGERARSGTRSEVLEMVDSAVAGKSFLDWHEVALALRALGVDPFSWDVLLVASEFVQYEQAGVAKLIPNLSDRDGSARPPDIGG
jgi:nucleoside diphosphate kinase